MTHDDEGQGLARWLVCHLRLPYVSKGDSALLCIPTGRAKQDPTLDAGDNPRGLRTLASRVGTPLYIDQLTKNRGRVSFARVLIEMGIVVSYPNHSAGWQ